MTDTDWIRDRLPTVADADEKGEVLTPHKTTGQTFFQRWQEVRPNQQWRHTSRWRSIPTTTPRLFASITRTKDRYLALADDGTAWENWGQGWVQLDPLPAREVAA